ncbi:MAG: hypothetical protein ABFD75_04780 [Smithella sp.]
MLKHLYSNPFQITSPEDLSAEKTVNLFVDVFTDFQKIIDPGHVFLIGPRGAGKSMMFRYLQPDCQCLAKECKLADLPFLGVYIPLKNTNFALAELRRLEHRHASDILNEHILVTHFCIKIFETLSKNSTYADDNLNALSVKHFYNDVFWPTLIKTTPGEMAYQIDDLSSASEIFAKMMEISEILYNQALTYAKKLAFRQDFIPYDGSLCDYVTFLVPIVSNLSQIPGFPKGPIYLLIDDAHWLTDTQARALNSWVATRSSRKISLKISTQYNYKTYYTATGATIDTPHDYSEIDIATIYTGSNKSKYRERIAAIVNKRLSLFGIKNITAEQYFPEDNEQENAISKIAEDYKKKYDEGNGRGFYRSDDALRYARPDYIKSLAGSSKSSSTYSYAGFNQLVHLSSGIVRHFIHPAHIMYAEAKNQLTDPSKKIEFIPPSIQNKTVREEANNFLFSDLERIEKEGHVEAPPKEDIKRLSNLVQGLGGLFRQILLSDRSERKVFSIAFSDTPSESVEHILDLGVQLGYFHRSTIGRKDSKSGGRTRLFVLNRRLAPVWTLDPTGFAAYLFVDNNLIEEGMKNPSSMLRRVAKKGLQEEVEIVQIELF